MVLGTCSAVCAAALGRLTQASDDDSIVQLTYDSLGRVLTETQGDNPLGTTGKTVTYTVDAEGNQTEIDYPSGFEAHRTFDDLNRLTLLEDSSSNDVASWTRYGAANRRDVLSYENGTKRTWGWDGFRRPTTITQEDSGSSYLQGSPTAVCVALLRAPHGGSDNPAFEARSHQSGKGDTASPRSGTYDRANRLIKVLQDVDEPANEVANPGAEAYADEVPVRSATPQHGRRAGLTSLVTTPYGDSAATVSYSTNAMNEYTSVGGTSHSYDDNGNLVDDGTYEYVYDAHNHLIEVIDPAGPTTIATYTYDALGLGRRSSKTEGSDTTRFVYANQQCLEEYDGSGNLLRLFAFGQAIDEVAMMEAPDVADVDGDLNTTELKRFYYHTQLLGSVTQLTDPDEVVVESYDYGPYGEITIKDIGGSTVSTSQIGNPFTYTGRRLDEESGLYYYRARHYSSELKRFIQRDLLEYADGPSAYGYVRARAVSGVDPTGRIGPGIGPDGELLDPLSDPALGGKLPRGIGPRFHKKKPRRRPPTGRNTETSQDFEDTAAGTHDSHTYEHRETVQDAEGNSFSWGTIDTMRVGFGVLFSATSPTRYIVMVQYVRHTLSWGDPPSGSETDGWHDDGGDVYPHQVGNDQSVSARDTPGFAAGTSRSDMESSWQVAYGLGAPSGVAWLKFTWQLWTLATDGETGEVLWEWKTEFSITVPASGENEYDGPHVSSGPVYH